MTHTDHTQPAIPTGQELYDSIMSGIEPELTTEGLKTLDAKYAHESEEEKKERAARYDAAFKEYDRQFQDYNDSWMKELRTYKRSAIASVEEQSRATEDKAVLDTIESSLQI